MVRYDNYLGFESISPAAVQYVFKKTGHKLMNELWTLMANAKSFITGTDADYLSLSVEDESEKGQKQFHPYHMWFHMMHDWRSKVGVRRSHSLHIP